MRKRSRLLAGLACTLVLLLPSAPASAGDDPVPQKWPAIQDPGASTGTPSDPKPLEWPDVAPPDTSSASDPKPKQWPAPQPA